MKVLLTLDKVNTLKLNTKIFLMLLNEKIFSFKNIKQKKKKQKKQSKKSAKNY